MGTVLGDAFSGIISIMRDGSFCAFCNAAGAKLPSVLRDKLLYLLLDDLHQPYSSFNRRPRDMRSDEQTVAVFIPEEGALPAHWLLLNDVEPCRREQPIIESLHQVFVHDYRAASQI